MTETASRLRVLFVMRSLEAGGAERQTVLLAKALVDRGHAVGLLLFYPDGELREEAAGAGIDILDAGKGGRYDIVAFGARAARLTRRFRPDVVHGLLPMGDLVALAIGRLALRGNGRGRPTVVFGVRRSDLDLAPYGRLQRAEYRAEARASRLADVVVANSQAGAAAARALGMPAARIAVVRNAVDTDRFRPDPAARSAAREAWGFRPGDIVVGLVARNDPVKGHRLFVDAFAAARQADPGLRAVCLGAGTPGGPAAEAMAMAAELGVDGDMRWTPPRPDVEAAYPGFDLCVSASASEGTPNAVAEAMACALPCVVTDVGDSAWLVGGTGEVVAPGDAGALRAAVERMAGEVREAGGGRPSRGEAARARAVDLLGVARLVDESLAAWRR